MKITRTRFIRIVKIATVAVAAAAVAGFVVWRSLPYARGPAIAVFQPISGSTISDKTIDIIGRADRVSALTVNDDKISMDESGNFREKLAVFPGANLITLGAVDRFGRTTKVTVEIYGLSSF